MHSSRIIKRRAGAHNTLLDLVTKLAEQTNLNAHVAYLETVARRTKKKDVRQLTELEYMNVILADVLEKIGGAHIDVAAPGEDADGGEDEESAEDTEADGDESSGDDHPRPRSRKRKTDSE